MKIRNLSLAINLVSIMFLSACVEANLPEQSMRAAGCLECQRLEEWLTDCRGEGTVREVETVVFFSGQNCNKPLKKMTFKKFQEEVLSYAGCLSNKSAPMPTQSIECPECQRLRKWLAGLEDTGWFRKVETVMFLSEQGCRNPLDEMTFEEFQDWILFRAGCCSYTLNPVSKEWREYKRLECIWDDLEKEDVQQISFSSFSVMEEEVSPEDRRQWAVITKPEKISELLRLLREATEKEKDKFANYHVLATSDREQIQIVTNKHKYIIPIRFNTSAREITYGVGWTSYKLGKKLADWGLMKPMSEDEYRVLECVWDNLEKESIQSIGFYQYNNSGEWDLWGKIAEPRRTNEFLKLLHKALKEGDRTFEDEEYFEADKKPFVRMQIATDKQKYIIPFFIYRGAAYGQGWTLYELRKKLAEWGFPELE